jgi:hypothetical protein
MIRFTVRQPSEAFDALSARVTRHLTRRKSLGAIAIGGVAGVGTIEDGASKKKKK